MLNETEKLSIEILYKIGLSYQEIALEILSRRNALALAGLAEETKSYIKEKDQ